MKKSDSSYMYFFLQKFSAVVMFCFMSFIFFNSTTTQAKSLFGDYSCKRWETLDQSAKKLWTNAFLAPLSLTYKGLKKASKDSYNDDPNSAESAIDSINVFCQSNADLDVTAGAVNYLESISK